MKYADCPAVTVTTDVAAPAATVWALVSNIERSSRFSFEVSSAQSPAGATGPSREARYVGHSPYDGALVDPGGLAHVPGPGSTRTGHPS